ncbi:MAG: hypothetical protein V3U17_02285 [Thermoplasmata archaeon]
MNRKLIILVVMVVAVVIVAIFAAPLFLGAVNPPVDVYARPTPPTSESPLDLLPSQVLGFDLTLIEDGSSDDKLSAMGFYGGGFRIIISRFSSEGAASSEVDASISFAEDTPGSMTSVHAGEQHWLTFTGGGTSIFLWRKGVWLFLVSAPDEALRNQVVEELPF